MKTPATSDQNVGDRIVVLLSELAGFRRIRSHAAGQRILQEFDRRKRDRVADESSAITARMGLDSAARSFCATSLRDPSASFQSSTERHRRDRRGNAARSDCFGAGNAVGITVRAMNITDVLTASRSPRQNGVIERFIGSVRRECLDHVIVFNANGLQRNLSRYVEYYKRSRTPLALD
jgi:transposase InsO family protein